MTGRVLCVDDDGNVLASCKRTLGRRFDITTALGPVEGLETVKNRGPFAVILSDMRMPEMDGIAFICAARELAPETVCMMLTGCSDQETAMEAVNRGQIFRFLTKPCPRETLNAALEAGIGQYRLVTAERELLQKTLTGSVKALIEALSMVNPQAFGRGSRIKPIVQAMVREMKLPGAWQFEIAALLSHIGCIVLPPETVDKVYHRQRLSPRETEMFASHPAHGAKLLQHIPRLEVPARMIAAQDERFDGHEAPDPADPDGAAVLGGQILHAACALDSHLSEGLGRAAALGHMKEREGEYNPELLAVLERVALEGADEAPNGEVQALTIWKLASGMYAGEDITAMNGTLLVPKGHEITAPLIERLKNFANGVGIKEPIQVLVPQKVAHAA